MDRMGTVQSLPVTPFFDDGRIDEKSLRRLTDYQVEGGVDGIMALGRIGETYGMSVEENKQCMRIVAEQVDKRVQLGFGVGADHTDLAIQLAGYAEQIGADYVMVHAARNVDMLSHFRRLAGAISIGVMLYDGGEGREIPVREVMLPLAKEFPNVVATKIGGVTSSVGGIAVETQKLKDIKEQTGLTCLCGFDVMSMYFYTGGSDGVIASTAAVMPKQEVAIARAVHAGNWDEARRIFYGTMLPLALYGRFPYTASVWKHVLMWRGIITSARVRWPWLPIDAAKKQELRAVLKMVDFASQA